MFHSRQQRLLFTWLTDRTQDLQDFEVIENQSN